MENIEDQGATWIQEYLDAHAPYCCDVKWVRIEDAPSKFTDYKYEIVYEVFDEDNFRTIRDWEYSDTLDKSVFEYIARRCWAFFDE